MECIKAEATRSKKSRQSINVERRREEIRREMERLSYVFTKGRMEPEEYDQRYDVRSLFILPKYF